jgi:hypothetical protein
MEYESLVALLLYRLLTLSLAPGTIGNVTAGVAITYITYQLYFDWMRSHHLKPIRQIAWAFLHFPFHMALTLFVEGATQFIILGKIFEVTDDAVTKLFSNVAPTVRMPDFIKQVNSTLNEVLSLYPPKIPAMYSDIYNSVDALAQLPDDLFSRMNDASLNMTDDAMANAMNNTSPSFLNGTSANMTDADVMAAIFVYDIIQMELLMTLDNSLVTTFSLEVFKSINASNLDEGELFVHNLIRFYTVVSVHQTTQQVSS